MEALRIQPPKPSARSMLSPLFPRSPSSAARKKAPPLVSRSGRENANPNVYNDPPPSPSPLLAGKASPRRADGVLRKERPRLVDALPGDDVSPDPSDPSVKVSAFFNSYPLDCDHFNFPIEEDPSFKTLAAMYVVPRNCRC